MQQHIVIPLPKGVSITAAREIASVVEDVVRRGTGTTAEATVTDLHLTDQERRVLDRALDVSQGFATFSAAFDAPMMDTLADLRTRIDPDAVPTLTGCEEHGWRTTKRGPPCPVCRSLAEADREACGPSELPHPENLTRSQELAADAMASEYGRSRVRHVADGAVVIIGMTDDVERRSVCIERDGRERWRA